MEDVRYRIANRIVWSLRPSRIITLVLLFAFINSLNAQQASASLDSNHYRIGEWIPLHLEVTAPKGANIIWPMIDVSIDELEVLDRSDIDSTSSLDSKSFSQTLTLTVFDSGYYAVPPFDFIIDHDTVSTDALILRIHSVELDTSQIDIKPIKDPMDAPITFKEILPYLLGGLGLIALGILLALLWKRRKREPEITIIPEITIPPHEWALEELEKLRNDKLWQTGQVKAYYIRLTDILRWYIELRYKQPAMESTTGEIMDRLGILSLSAALLEKVKSTLVLGDLVKFAKAKPVANEHEMCFDSVMAFVNETKLETNKDGES